MISLVEDHMMNYATVLAQLYISFITGVNLRCSVVLWVTFSVFLLLSLTALSVLFHLISAWLAQLYGNLMGLGIFVYMYVIFLSSHSVSYICDRLTIPKGFITMLQNCELKSNDTSYKNGCRLYKSLWTSLVKLHICKILLSLFQWFRLLHLNSAWTWMRYSTCKLSFPASRGFLCSGSYS